MGHRPDAVSAIRGLNQEAADMHKAYKLETTILPGGKVELILPLAEGTPVEILVIVEAEEDYSDLAAAAASSTDFWDNPIDDAEWNNA